MQSLASQLCFATSVLSIILGNPMHAWQPSNVLGIDYATRLLTRLRKALSMKMNT